MSPLLDANLEFDLQIPAPTVDSRTVRTLRHDSLTVTLIPSPPEQLALGLRAAVHPDSAIAQPDRRLRDYLTYHGLTLEQRIDAGVWRCYLTGPPSELSAMLELSLRRAAAIDARPDLLVAAGPVEQDSLKNTLDATLTATQLEPTEATRAAAPWTCATTAYPPDLPARTVFTACAAEFPVVDERLLPPLLHSAFAVNPRALPTHTNCGEQPPAHGITPLRARQFNVIQRVESAVFARRLARPALAVRLLLQTYDPARLFDPQTRTLEAANAARKQAWHVQAAPRE